MLCANEYIRKYFSIIVDFMTNYKKQIIITNVKNDKYCFICQMFSDNRENLKKVWFYKNHDYTLKQLRKQVNKIVANIDANLKQFEKNFDSNIDFDENLTRINDNCSSQKFQAKIIRNFQNMNIHIIENFV